MSGHERREEKLSAAEFRERLNELLERAGRGELRIVVEQEGAPAAALISARDLERLKYDEKRWEQLFAVFDELHARNADVDPEQVERDVAEVIAQTRQEQRERNASRPGA